METLNRTMSKQTERLIKGLEYMVKAREEILSSFTETYGDTDGERMYQEAFESDMTDLMMTLKCNIGYSMEVNMGDLTRQEF